MKLPLLVFSLIVVYWACISCAEEEINSTRDVTNLDDEYTFDYQDVPWERSLSRNKRSLIINPIIKPMMDILLKTVEKATGFSIKIIRPLIEQCIKGSLKISSILLGTGECPKMEISLNLDAPLNIVTTIICKLLDIAGEKNRQLMTKVFKSCIVFTKKVMLPATHTGLNTMKDTGLLPAPINNLIVMFNTMYSLMKLVGYI